MHIWAQNIHYFMYRTICTMDICILNTLKTFKSFNIHNSLNLTPFRALCSYKSIKSEKWKNLKPRAYCRSLYWPICLFSIDYQQKIYSWSFYDSGKKVKFKKHPKITRKSQNRRIRAKSGINHPPRCRRSTHFETKWMWFSWSAPQK